MQENKKAAPKNCKNAILGTATTLNPYSHNSKTKSLQQFCLAIFLLLNFFEGLTLILLKSIMNNIKGGWNNGTSGNSRMDCQP